MLRAGSAFVAVPASVSTTSLTLRSLGWAMVSAVTFRPSALLIKAVTTLDVLSGGLAWLGIGAGYHADEARMMGLSLPPTGERFELLEDTLLLALQMWSGDDAAFEGRHLRLERPLNSPNSIQRAHPPILIGGTG